MVNDSHVMSIGVGIDSAIDLTLCFSDHGTLPFLTLWGTYPGRSVSQFTIGDLARLLSGHDGPAGLHCLCEPGQSTRRVKDNHLQVASEEP